MRLSVFASGLSLLVLGGCLVPSSADFNFSQVNPPKPPELLGDAAPALGPEGLQGFIVGRWAVATPGIDPEFAKQLGMGAIAEQQSGEAVVIDEIFDFNADGTFLMKPWNEDWKVTGKWTAGADSVSLTYEMYNDKTLAQLGEEKKKQAEVGSQAGVLGDLMYDNLMKTLQSRATVYLGKDRKSLSFFKPGPGGMPADLEAMMMLEELRRVKPEPKK